MSVAPPLPPLELVSWSQIDEKVKEWEGIFSNIENYLFIDFETYYSKEYSLSKKEMTYLKFIKHEFFKIHSASIKIGSGETKYYRDVEEIVEVIQMQLEENPDTVIAAAQVHFDAGILKYYLGIQPRFVVDLPSMSRAVWPNDTFHGLNAIAARLFPDDPSKQKTDDVSFMMGRYNLTEEEHERNAIYNIGDTELLADCVAYFMEHGFPVEVLVQQSIVLMMYLKPRFVADIPKLKDHLQETIETQDKALEKGLSFLKQSNLPKSFFTNEKARNKEKFPTQAAFAAAYRQKYGIPPMKNDSAEEWKKLLSSNPRFAVVLKLGYDIEPPLKPSPTNPDEFTFAFGVNDVEFQNLMASRRDLHDLWEARMYSKSNQEKTRTETFLEYAELAEGFIPVPLRPSAAHTHRLGGTENINMQNLGRNSPLRPSLSGGIWADGTEHRINGELFAVNATDSSNIESRQSAVFCDHEEKIELFETGGDPYNAMATQIFGYPVDRKSKTVDHSMQGAVGKATDLGCGYQMGVDRFRGYLNAGPLGMPPIFLEDIEELKVYPDPYKFIIDTYRNNNQPTVKTWYRLQGALREMQWEQTDIELNEFARIVGNRIWLPNGLSLHYPELDVTRDGIKYHGRNDWSFIFGGKCLENIIQAISQIIILRQMVWIHAYHDVLFGNDRAGCALQVHDEIVSVYPLGEDRLIKVEKKGRMVEVWPEGSKAQKIEKDLEHIMFRRPAGFERVPLAAEGGSAYSYSK